MPNSHTEVYIHLVWATWDRQPLITPAIETRLYNQIRSRCRNMQAHLHAIDGISDHIHLLIRLPATLSISEIVKDLKGTSSHFATHLLACPDFRWQGAYSAFSVGPEGVETVCSYIENQKKHHTQQSIIDEWELSAEGLTAITGKTNPRNLNASESAKADFPFQRGISIPSTQHGREAMNPPDKAFYEENGYTIAQALFNAEETAALREHYMQLREAGSYPGDFDGVDALSTDPLKRYPRMIHMHRWDEMSLKWLLDSRFKEAMTTLLGREPYAVQTMLYFKPGGARGQALHQDQFYLRVQPGTCMAAWLALDCCDEANGCMRVVPGSHLWPLLCPEKADITQSFTDVTVRLPENAHAVPALMEAGDVLFFHGSLVHGSFPNTTTDRFRRALIGHYIVGEAEKVGLYYQYLRHFFFISIHERRNKA